MGFEGGKQGIATVIAAFMIQFFTYGVSATIGVYNIEFLQHFQASASEVSFIAALNYGVFLGSGPIVSFLMARFSYRNIVLGGSVLLVLGLLAVPLYPNLYMMYLTIGVVVGFGSACAYLPSFTLSGLYYDKYRSLATGVATSGSGLGGAVMPVLAALFMDTYAWKGSFIILAGLCLHCLIFGALLRNPPAATPDEKDCDEFLLAAGDAATKTEKVSECDVCDAPHESTKKNNKRPTTGVIDSTNNDSCTLLNKHGGEGIHCKDAELQKDQNLTIEQEPIIPDASRHIYIFKNYNFVIYFINNYFWNASVCMMGAFVPEYYRMQGNSIVDVSWLVGSYGYGCFIGGILGGVLGNIKGVNRIYLFIFCCIFLGIFTIAIPLGNGFAYYAVLNVLNGTALGIALGLLIVVLADLIGIESLGNGMGYLMFSNGLGTLTGPVIAGVLIDTTKSYELNLYVSGVMSLVSGACMCLIPAREYLKSCRKMPVVSTKSNEDDPI